MVTHWSYQFSKQHNEATAKYLCRTLQRLPDVTTLFLSGCYTAYRSEPDLVFSPPTIEEKSQNNIFDGKKKITSNLDQEILDKANLSELEKIFLENYGMITKDAGEHCRIILSKLTNKSLQEVNLMTAKVKFSI